MSHPYQNQLSGHKIENCPKIFLYITRGASTILLTPVKHCDTFSPGSVILLCFWFVVYHCTHTTRNYTGLTLKMVFQRTNVLVIISWEWHGRPLQGCWSCKTSHVLCARPAPLSLYVMGSPCRTANATGLTPQNLLHQKVLKPFRAVCKYHAYSTWLGRNCKHSIVKLWNYHKSSVPKQDLRKFFAIMRAMTSG